jgi:ATP-binding cassette, subfamily A (ABC1), member 3
MGQGLFMILLAEGGDKGVNFGNMWSREVDLNFSFVELLIFMVFGCVLLIAFTFYVENISPGEFGIAKKWYFPLSPLIKSLRKHLRYRTLSSETILRERRISNSAYEDEPDSFKIGIQIKSLSKRFDDSKYAVNNLSLNLFEDQICVLLGHNGAGKTTTMSMLSGLFSPSSGTAFLNGKDIRTHPEEARESFGICPQNNVLFNELTVAEHLIFFCCLKGMTNAQELKQEVEYYTNLLELSDKTHEQSVNLSGGMKRKLSVAIALCGKAKICILDEPTSGMDPGARRALWDLLISEKKGRTILLSTHFMEEADILGDRIAIMSEGHLRTVGSSFFLKKKFGTGYKLTCVKSENFNNDATIGMLKKYAPDVYLQSENATEVTYIINEESLPVFGGLFQKIEDRCVELGISSFGCNLSTLEEVFIKLANETCHQHDDENEHDYQSTNFDIPSENYVEKVSGLMLIFNQMHAMFYKKMLVLLRNWTNLIFLVFTTAFTIVVVLNTPNLDANDEKYLKISLDTYGETETILNGNTQQLMDIYEKLFSSKKDHISVIEGNVEDYILKKANESLARVNHQFLIGASFSSDSITAWFNGYAYHSLPLTLNTINRAIIKSVVGSEYDITVTNQPYTMPIKTRDGQNIPNNSSKLIIILLLVYMLNLYWTNTFIAHYIKERNLRAKLLQYISGANRFIFWISSFIFDFLVLLIISSIILASIFLYQLTNFATFSEFMHLFVALQIFSISFFPFMYAFSFLFKNYSTGESMLLLTGVMSK